MNNKYILTAAIALTFTGTAYAQSTYHAQPIPIETRWSQEVTPTNALTEYPRPQLTRPNWQNLNGLWSYAITKKDAEEPKTYDGTILVPYPIESSLSGVKKALQPTENLWYKRSFTPPSGGRGARTLLHFGAVDWQTTVYVNGKEAGQHTGGYAEFTLDITDKLKAGTNELVIKVYDPTDQGTGPHGKQVLHPENIYYTATSGIWQTVWLEEVPQDYIDHLTITPDIDRSMVNITVHGTTNKAVSITIGNKTYKGKSNQNIALPLQGAGGLHLWSPADPYLYSFTATLGTDKVASYFGMRKISIAKDEKGIDRICLNNKPYYNLGTLDQGFWPDGLYTAPTDEALSFDIKAIKAMGFNTIRKHIKVEPARWYYWADKLGMLVWQDMVNPNQGLPEGAKPEFERESKEELTQLHNYPCITTWVLFNEKWGQYDQKRLTDWIKQSDPSRIVNGHTGELLYVNEQLRSPSPDAYVDADMTDVHSYPDPMMPIKQTGKAQVVGEFGGIGVFIADHQWNASSAWGYIQEKPAALASKYRIMCQHLELLKEQGLSGSIYTQPFDVEGEQNGLMTYDREVVKIPFETLRKIHSKLNPDANTTIPQVTAKDADLTEPTKLYADQLELYLKGNRDPQFLKQLAQQATQAGDKPGARMASDDYIQTLTAPYTNEDLSYIMQVTTSTKDKGFTIIQNNMYAIDSLIGLRQAEIKMMNIIYADLIAPMVINPEASPDWAALSQRVQPYGPEGKEILYRAKTFFYLNKQDYDSFAKAAEEYIEKYNQTISPDELNQWAWTVFQKVSDKTLITDAIKWSKLSDKEDNNPAFMDTRANLLYKTGNKEEAITLETKAASLSGDQSIKDNLEKMKSNQPTW